MQFALPDRLLYCFDREGWRVGFSNLELLANLPNRTLPDTFHCLAHHLMIRIISRFRSSLPAGFILQV